MRIPAGCHAESLRPAGESSLRATRWSISCVDDVYREEFQGQCVAARVLRGFLAPRDKLAALPSRETCVPRCRTGDALTSSHQRGRREDADGVCGRERGAGAGERDRRARVGELGRLEGSKGSLLVACESVFQPATRVVARVRVNDLVEVGCARRSTAETAHEGTHHDALRRGQRRRRHR